MALLTIAARARSSALRLASSARRFSPPATRASPQAAARRAFSSKLAGKEKGKGLNLASASEEELMRQANLVEKEIQECFARVRLEKEKVPRIRQDIFCTIKLWFCTGVGIHLMMLSADSDEAEEPKE